LDNTILTANLDKPVLKSKLIESLCKGKSVIDFGCINHNINNTKSSNWLHGCIKIVASRLLGVDYLEQEVAELKSQGFNVICADINKPIQINESFDVIHVGNLIEHLSNFDGLFENFNKLLKHDGIVVITTPNPFFIEQYFYTAFKNDLIVNSEHTCWLDPLTLNQLANRYKFTTAEIYWLKNKWQLFWVILNGKKFNYDIMTSTWHKKLPLTFFQRFIGNIYLSIMWILSREKLISLKLQYNDQLVTFGYISVVSNIFKLFWALYKKIIITSKINKYELYVSILKKEIV
jgi:2-polyprenyl-3-methyl-5-hydroxy-6-metoxy-1,4-benzoquinol methylase